MRYSPSGTSLGPLNSQCHLLFPWGKEEVAPDVLSERMISQYLVAPLPPAAHTKGYCFWYTQQQHANTDMRTHTHSVPCLHVLYIHLSRLHWHSCTLTLTDTLSHMPTHHLCCCHTVYYYYYNLSYYQSLSPNPYIQYSNTPVSMLIVNLVLALTLYIV